MNMNDWAENEIKIACKIENPDWTPDSGEFDYGCSCYTSALKAYKSMLEDEHSGMSWSLTVGVLNRLLKHKPLSSIVDEDFNATQENEIFYTKEDLESAGLKSKKQCPRMSSLFRDEFLDGTIKYTDVDRYYCFDINEPDCTYTGGMATKLIDELFPIKMPYYPPSTPYKIACEELTNGEGEEECCMCAYLYIITPSGDKVDVNKFYKQVKDGEPVTTSYESPSFIDANGNEVTGQVREITYQPTKWVDITSEEYYNKKELLQDVSKQKE